MPIPGLCSLAGQPGAFSEPLRTCILFSAAGAPVQGLSNICGDAALCSVKTVWQSSICEMQSKETCHVVGYEIIACLGEWWALGSLEQQWAVPGHLIFKLSNTMTITSWG